MKIRTLQKAEHGLTRPLWELVFAEDSKAFLDYYYFFKTQENEILVIEEDGAIRSMLHLNPYLIRAGEQQFNGHYIIGVATECAYRKRGYMAMLLKDAMQKMYERKELFTFLMPAAEAIYTPYDFRFVYDQTMRTYVIDEQQDYECSRGLPEGVVVAEAGIGDGKDLADFFNEYFSEKFQVYAMRSAQYYQTMLFEQQSECGGIKIIKKNGRLIGTFLYGDEEGLEIREPLYLEGYEREFRMSVRQLCEERGQREAVIYAGIFETTIKKPMIMIRIIHLESFLSTLRTKAGEQINCSFAVIDSFLSKNSRIWRLQGGADAESRTVFATETEDSEGVLSIAAFTSLVFGYKEIEEIAKEPGVFLTEHLMDELKKIQPLQKIYLNEIV